MPSSRELRQERANVIQQSRDLLDTAEAETRDLTTEEQEQWDRLMAEADTLQARIERQERVAEAERGLDNPVNRAAPGQSGAGGGDQPIEFRSRGLRALGERSAGWSSEPEWRALLALGAEDRARAFGSWLRNGASITPAEARALQVDSDTAGGYLVAPIQFVDGLLQAMDNLVHIRQLATVYAVPNAESLGVPTLDTDPADPTWTSEIATGSEDSSMAFGFRELNPAPLAKRIKISRKLWRKVPDVEGLVQNRLGYKFAVTAENAYQNGTGANQPLGIFVASANGINTDRDVSTGNTTTEIRFDGLMEAKYTLKPQYWPRARWLFHRDAQKQIAKLKDGDGQYLWRESVRVGEPDRILGHPVALSEYTPNTFTTGLYVGALADLSYYWIADALDMEFQRLAELYAETNQIGIIGRLESDGMPVMPEAFVRVTLA